MQEGAFALIDCLGFKGIWKETPPENVLAKFRQVEKAIQASLNNFPRITNDISDARLRIEWSLLSDTVAISIQFEKPEGSEPDEREKGGLTFLVCMAVVEVLNLFLTTDPALLLRGCVTFGKHLCDRNFIVGPAVDDAAECMNLADGAFVWLHPSADEKYRSAVQVMTENESTVEPRDSIEVLKRVADITGEPGMKSQIDLAVRQHGPEKIHELIRSSFSLFKPLVIHPYPMPIKGGGYLECGVINPLVLAITPEERQARIKIYENRMVGNRLDVWLKRQNTLAFLTAASKQMDVYVSQFFGIASKLA